MLYSPYFQVVNSSINDANYQSLGLESYDIVHYAWIVDLTSHLSALS